MIITDGRVCGGWGAEAAVLHSNAVGGAQAERIREGPWGDGHRELLQHQAGGGVRVQGELGVVPVVPEIQVVE